MPLPPKDSQKIRFLSVFDEDKNETLKLRKKIKVYNDIFEVGEEFKKGEKIAGVDFHLLRYFDLVAILKKDDIYEITGFIPQE